MMDAPNSNAALLLKTTKGGPNSAVRSKPGSFCARTTWGFDTKALLNKTLSKLSFFLGGGGYS